MRYVCSGVRSAIEITTAPLSHLAYAFGVGGMLITEEKEMDNELKQWREDGKHLPEFLRDFHDQKDVFKAIAEIIEIDKDDPAYNVSWVQAHVYTIDVFLWFMARYGYTLQRSRAKKNFENLNTTLQDLHNYRADQFSKLLSEGK